VAPRRARRFLWADLVHSARLWTDHAQLGSDGRASLPPVYRGWNKPANLPPRLRFAPVAGGFYKFPVDMEVFIFSKVFLFALFVAFFFLIRVHPCHPW
jgi:hypothetical protein